ncbi:MAG: nuclear transport factor 2 family protein [Flavobacteriaceae bacterium]|nr:nuclear transport factor 2 family protein [Flavobacteriaceae bacterium]
MRRTIFFVLFSILLLNLNSCKTARHTESDKQLTENNHPVKELYMSSIEAFNQGNLDLFLANFDFDIKMYGTDGMYFGIDALRNRFDKVFKQFPNVRMEILELKLEILSKAVVLVHFKWKVYPMGQGPAYSGLGSGVYMFKENKWTEILEAERVTEMDKELIRTE